MYSDVKGNEKRGRCIFGVVMHLFGKCKHYIRTRFGSTFLSFWFIPLNRIVDQVKRRIDLVKSFPLSTFYTSMGLLKNHGIYCTWPMSMVWPLNAVPTAREASSSRREAYRNASTGAALFKELFRECDIHLNHYNWPQAQEKGQRDFWHLLSLVSFKRSAVRVLSAAGNHWFKPISEWRRSQSPAAEASWWAGQPGWWEFHGSSLSSALCCWRDSGRCRPWSTPRSC